MTDSTKSPTSSSDAARIAEIGKVARQGQFLAVASRAEAEQHLREAREALIAAGMQEKPEELDAVIEDVSREREMGRGRGWRWSRPPGHEEGLEGEKVSSEISMLFRAMFEITRGVQQHEASVRAVRQRDQEAGTQGDVEARRQEQARVLRQIEQERAEALTRLRERTPQMRESINRALRNLEEQPPQSLGPRTQAIRERLVDLRAALEKSDEGDDAFFAALREFVNESGWRKPEPNRPGPPPSERIARVQREINMVKDRLRELETELARLRQAESSGPHEPAALPPPRPGSPPRQQP